MDERTYHCAQCKDIGHVVWRDDKGLTWARRCDHQDPSGRRFSFPKGTWAYTAPLPGILTDLIKHYPNKSSYILLTGKANHATAAALQVATQLKHARPRYVDAMTAPQDFSESPTTWVSLYDSNGLLVIDSIDRRLRPPQVRAIVDLLHRKERPVIMIGDPPSMHPSNEPWLALGTELHKKQTEIIKL
jgi:hypothetical protein